MKKHILLLSLAACTCASICTSYTQGRKNKSRAKTTVVKATVKMPPAAPTQPAFIEVPKQNGVEIKLSDKTIYLSKEEAEKLCSLKINDSGIKHSSNPRPVDLSSIDSKSFEFMQRFMDLSAQKLFTFLDSASEDVFKLIRFNANELKLDGKFKTACHIKMLQDPARYAKDEYWQRWTRAQLCCSLINRSGLTDDKWENVVETYFGRDWSNSDPYRIVLIKDDGNWQEYLQKYNEEQARVIKIHAAVEIIAAHINYHQGVFQAPAPLKTDFLKECFYKLDIAHQNKLINNNLVTLS